VRRVATELHHAFPQFTLAQIADVVEKEITADASAIKLLEMDAASFKKPSKPNKPSKPGVWAHMRVCGNAESKTLYY